MSSPDTQTDAAGEIETAEARCTDTAEFIRALHPAGVFEARALNVKEKPASTFTATASGYYTVGRITEAAKDINALDRAGLAEAIYVTLNPANPAFTARADHRLKAKAKHTTTDAEIVSRTAFVLDIDPTRAAGISATDEEMQAALDLADKVNRDLTARGWPSPLAGMSGNGAYLIYRVDLPNDVAATELIRAVLKGLAERFDTAAAKIDLSTFNASRLLKALGTTPHKGDATADRPHRQSWFIRPATELQAVSRVQLEAVAATEPDEKAAPRAKRTRGSNGAAPKERCRKYLDKMPESVEGKKGSNPLFAAACMAARFGLDDADGLDVLRWYSENKSIPPWTEKEIRHKWTDAQKKVDADGDRGSMLEQHGSDRRRGRSGAPETATRKTPSTRPEILITDRHLRDVSDEAIAALKLANETSPKIFQYGNGLARIKNNDAGPTIDGLGIDSATHELARVADWKRTRFIKGGGSEEVPTSPPKNIAADVLAFPEYDLPRIRGIITAPTFSRDGVLIIAEGFDAPSGLWHHRTIADIPAVPQNPTQTDIDQAREFLIEPLADFPFVDAPDLTNAIAFQITLSARELIEGVTPAFGFDAPRPGSGKGLAIGTLLYPALGEIVAKATAPKDPDEWRKRITAELAQGKAAVIFDNVTHKVESEHLAAALTAEVWTDRQLGVTKMLRLPNRCVWGITGNHLEFSEENNRRVCMIRLDPKCQAPEYRTDFSIPDLMLWNRKNRGRQLHAILTLIAAWISRGRPKGTQIMGSFEGFAATVGGILDVAGFDGFLENRRPIDMIRWLEQETIDAPNAITEKREAIDRYNAWRKKQGKPPITAQTFGAELRRHRPNLVDRMPRRGSERMDCYAGIALKGPGAEAEV